MTDDLMDSKERISALVDGELHGEAFAQTLVHLQDVEQARLAWEDYLRVGEALRCGLASPAHDTAFLQRLRSKLAVEAAGVQQQPVLSELPARRWHFLPNSANQSGWKAVAALASVALVGVFVWQGNPPAAGPGNAGPALAMQALPVGAVAPQPELLAQGKVNGAAVLVSTSPSAQAPVAVSAPVQQVMMRNPQLDALLAAHRQMGATSTLQTPSGFLRSVTFDESRR